MEERYPLKKLRLDKLIITFSISNCRTTVFNYVLYKKPLKAPGNRMGTMVQKQKKNISSTLPFMRHSRMNQYLTKISCFYVKGVMRFQGRRPHPPWYLMWFQKPLVSEGLRHRGKSLWIAGFKHFFLTYNNCNVI